MKGTFFFQLQQPFSTGSHFPLGFDFDTFWKKEQLKATFGKKKNFAAVIPGTHVSFQLEAISGKNRARKMLLHAGCILHSAFFIIAISCCIRGSPLATPPRQFHALATLFHRFSTALHLWRRDSDENSI